MLSLKTRTMAAMTSLFAMANLMLAPMAALAQAHPQLDLKATGEVQKWNRTTKTWDPFTTGVAQEGDTFRAIEGGSLDCTVVGEGTSVEKMHLHSCSAVRFVKLNLTQGGNTIYCKAFGQIQSWMGHDRWASDDLKLEYPVSMEVMGRDVHAPRGTGVAHTTYQTPTAASTRLAIYENSAAKAQGLSFVRGTIESINPADGTFLLKEANTGRVDTVTCRGWTQVARPTLQARIMNETPAMMVQSLHVGDTVTVYGVATAGRPLGSLPQGMGAFAQTTPINFQATVVFPNGGLYIFGGTFVLSSPIVPAVGDGVTADGLATLENGVGQLTANLLPGIQLVNVTCEIGNEAFVVPPPEAPVEVAAGSLGGLPLFILLGAGAAILFHPNNGGTTLINASP